MKRLALSGFIFGVFMTALSAQAVSLKNYDSYLKRWDVHCDSGSFLGFLRVDSDGYYSSSNGGGVSKNRDEIISYMVRNSSGSCS